MAIRLLTLDLDNTLWETDSVIIRAEQATHTWMQQHCPQAAAFYSPEAIREYRLQIAECYPDLRFRVSRLREEVLRRVFMQSGVDREQAIVLAEEAFQVFYRERSKVTLFEGALTALEELASRYPLMAVTNGNADLDLIGIRHLFQGHFSAEQIGAPKPDADVFLAALQQAGVSAAETLHIGDHPEQDIAAAQQLGMKTIWVNVQQQDWPLSTYKPDGMITQLSQLPAQVSQLVQQS